MQNMFDTLVVTWLLNKSNNLTIFLDSECQGRTTKKEATQTNFAQHSKPKHTTIEDCMIY